MLNYNPDNLNRVITAIKKHLTPDLINKEYRERNSHNSDFGQCMNASGVLVHFFKDHLQLYSAEDIKNYQHFGRGRFYHWWVVDKQTGKILDITSEQYKNDKNNLEKLYRTGEKQSSIAGFRQYRERLNTLLHRVKKELNMADELVISKNTQLTDNQLHEIMSEIAKVGREVVNSSIVLGIAIAKHKNEIYWDQLNEELKKWMDPTVISMYVRIGNNVVLTNKQNWEKLPPSYNTLYHLSSVPADDLQISFDKGKVSPRTTLADAVKLSDRFKKQTGSKKTVSKELSVSVSIKYKDGSGKKQITREHLNKLKMTLDKQGAIVKWSDF